jgi:exopolyphosphatase/guanosine-5'-triphosphate,3'-diphosphate pyrophosphatase
VRRACVDIGSNTTRLLVADCAPGSLCPIHQERSFTRLGRHDGRLTEAKIDEVAATVASQLETAARLGALEVHGVATAAIRRAANGAELLERIRSSCGLKIDVLSAEEEARLAFVGAARTLDHLPAGALGVVDVGGGSSELVVGAPPDQVSWCASFEFGSGDLAVEFLHSDPPSEAELDRAREHVAEAMAGLPVPEPIEAVAVGGSATSLARVAGPLLDAEAFSRSLSLLGSARAAKIAALFQLDQERVRLLPAGLLILQAAAQRFGVALAIARGGIREGVLLEAER